MSDRWRTRVTHAALAIAALAAGIVFSAVLAASGASPAAGDAAADDQFPRDTLPNCAGGELSLPAARGRAATVLVCMSIECPISNEYTPTLNRLAEKYQSRGVNFIGINPNAGQTLREMADHVRDFKLAFPFVKDAAAKVSHHLLFAVTPEVCVFDPAGKLAYRGRIDDRYRARGGAAGSVVSSDLEKALEEVLAGKPVSVSRTRPVGCPIQLGLPQGARDPVPSGEQVTYSRQIAPIFQEHCQECHRTGGVGSFALTDYAQAVSWAEDIRQFTSDGKMPPWKPVADFGEFKNRRALDDAEKSLIARWVAQGCAEGDRADLPEPRVFSTDWRLGEPDLVLMPSEEYHVDADGPDVYRNFVLPVQLDHNCYIAAVEVVPGNPKVVHHVLNYFDDSGVAERLDARDPGPGYSSSQGLPGFIPVGGLGGWAPGNLMGFLPEGMARILPRKANIVMQVHYHKNGKDEVDRTRLGIHFAKGKVTRSVQAVMVMPPGGPLSGMTIPAGADNHEVRVSYGLPDGGYALNVTPHMHLLGKDMKVTAVLPDGNVLPLVYVKDWDFNWQELYSFRQMIALPAGSRLEMVVHFDNSEANPHNPSHPPKLVRWGEETTDEMCIAFVDMTSLEEAASESELRLPSRSDAVKMLLQGEINENAVDNANPLKRLSERLIQTYGGKIKKKD